MNTNNVRYGYAWSINKDPYFKQPGDDGIYYLYNKASGYYLDQNQSNRNVTQYPFIGGLNQQWLVTPPDSSGYVQIKNGSTSSPGTLCFGTLIDTAPSWYASVQKGASFPLSFSNYNNQGFFIMNNYSSAIYEMLRVENISVSSSNAVWVPIGKAANWTVVSPNSYLWCPEKLNYWKGDVDMDGQITSADGLLALKFSTGAATLTDAQQYLADINGDGVVTSADALIINKMAVGDY